jgi:transposase InsO family protein
MEQKSPSPIETAHFKFALIAPVIQGLHPDGTAAAYFRRVTAEPIRKPDGTFHRYKGKTLEKWAQLYKKGGMDALMPSGRSDKGTTRVLPDTAIGEIYRLKEKYPRLNATQIHFILIRDAYIPATVSVAAVQRFVRKNDLKSGRVLNVKDRKAFEEEEFGRLWQADTCFLPCLTENGNTRRTYLIMIIDDHSRLIVGGGIFYNDNALNFQMVFKQAVASYGIPDKIYTDNGSPYANGQLSLICGSIGTLNLRAPVGDGASKGKIERSFRTLKDRWVNGLDMKQVRSLKELNAMLKSYVLEYNRTYHTAIKETPIDRFMRTGGSIRMPRSREWLDECFHNRVNRKVNNNSCISMDGILYDAPMQFIGMNVEVRFLPGAMDGAYILHDGLHYPIKKTDKAANARTKRGNLPKIDYTMGGFGNEQQ